MNNAPQPSSSAGRVEADPIGVKGLGEVVPVGVAPAIAHAVFNAAAVASANCRSGPSSHRYLERAEVHGRTAICVLTHDARFDIPLLRPALGPPVGRVGAMGSRRTHERRLELLREAGATEEQLVRLLSPIGLDLGAHTPEETAIPITAEITAHAHHGTGLPLSPGTGPVHAGV